MCGRLNFLYCILFSFNKFNLFWAVNEPFLLFLNMKCDETSLQNK